VFDLFYYSIRRRNAMRLANRALIAALATLVICTAVSAQTLRSPNDPRNQSPSVGTGGPEGGPTGLFTIYDGDTLRRGEFTFSIAYSNYDRDPGNVDITEVPLSFNIGLNDHIELFFKTTGYRGIKVNSPANLSSFYLPNVGFLPNFPFVSGPAIILAPSGPNVGTLAGQAVFRPFGNQPFVQFPFVGGSAGNFGQGPGNLGSLFGFPGFNAQIGTPFGGGSGHFGDAAFFPGMGSPVGSILPGVVLSTAVLPATALTLPITVPVTFTIAPSYLPDAPFISRPYGQSTFNDFVFGAKIRFTGPHNPLGVGIIPFYRWWADKPSDFSGFNMMQRGAGPGGSLGDFGLIGFIDGRLGKHVNVSVNGGYIINSNPRSDAFGASNITLLDRPNEFLAGIGVDFPINKHFQPVFEARSLKYVGNRTPNAFENQPVDLLGGVKIYPKRWFGLGLWYRRHMNQQDQGHFNAVDFNTTINQLSGVFVPGRGIVIVPGTTRPATSNGFPLGFQFSDNPNGFGVQIFAGHRNARTPPPVPIPAPTGSVSASSASITLPCPPETISETCPTTANMVVTLNANFNSPQVLVYTWSVTGGKITGEGKSVTWDLTGAQPGTYTATVSVSDGTNPAVTSSTTVTIANCSDCHAPPCPTVNVSCPSDVDVGSPITFTASVTNGPPNVTYNWSVSAGTITSGQGTSSITVDTTNIGGQTVTATVEVGGLAAACTRTASCSTAVKAPVIKTCEKVDEYGNIKFNDEKARLDAFASRLQTDAGSTGYIIGYGTCEGEGLARANRAKDYLVNTRGIDAGRITTVDGGCRAELLVQLYVCPQGATPPIPMTDGAVTPCPECKKKRTPRTRHPVRHGKKKAGADDDEDM
jgi:hypothetical protein